MAVLSELYRLCWYAKDTDGPLEQVWGAITAAWLVFYPSWLVSVLLPQDQFVGGTVVFVLPGTHTSPLLPQKYRFDKVNHRVYLTRSYLAYTAAGKAAREQVGKYCNTVKLYFFFQIFGCIICVFSRNVLEILSSLFPLFFFNLMTSWNPTAINLLTYLWGTLSASYCESANWAWHLTNCSHLRTITYIMHRKCTVALNNHRAACWAAKWLNCNPTEGKDLQ